LKKEIEKDLFVTRLELDKKSSAKSKNPWIRYSFYVPTPIGEIDRPIEVTIKHDRARISRNLTPVAEIAFEPGSSSEQSYRRILEAAAPIRDEIWNTVGRPSGYRDVDPGQIGVEMTVEDPVVEDPVVEDPVVEEPVIEKPTSPAPTPTSADQVGVYAIGDVPKFVKTPALDVNIWGRDMPEAKSMYIDRHNVVSILSRPRQGWCVYAAQAPEERDPPLPQFRGCYRKLKTAKLAVQAAYAGDAADGIIDEIARELETTKADVDSRIRNLCEALKWTQSGEGKCPTWATHMPRAMWDKIRQETIGKIELIGETQFKANVDELGAKRIRKQARELNLRISNDRIEVPRGTFIEIQETDNPRYKTITWWREEEARTPEYGSVLFGAKETQHMGQTPEMQVMSILRSAKRPIQAFEVKSHIGYRVNRKVQGFTDLDLSQVSEALRIL
jgi:hypothetical protein